jgi:NADH-quinone oxidoreductase subunit C
VTSNTSETAETTETTDEVADVVHPLQGFADEVAEAVGGTAEVSFDTVKITLDPEEWIDAHSTARDDFDLVFFSFLSAIDWAHEVAVGDPPSDEDFEERLEVITTVSDLTAGRRVTFSTSIDKEDPSIPSLVSVYAGANWHEREAHEMFGITFDGHPMLKSLYLPDGFEGNPLRKSFPLLSREVKPWPGKVDVEDMPEKPSTENPGA